MKWIKRSLAMIISLLLLLSGILYLMLNQSLPQYTGAAPAAVSQNTQLLRDAQGYLTIRAAQRTDAAYALGFAHAQERLFQMDLLRRNAAGELAELFGEKALDLDLAQRQHRFRDRAEQVLQILPNAQRQILQSYSRGVNAAIRAQKIPPFEYWLVLQRPRAWQETDSLLVIFSMYLDLQGHLGKDDLAQAVLKAAVPAEWYQFLNQHSSDWQAPLDGRMAQTKAMPDSPYPRALTDQKVACRDCSWRDSRDIGSNNFAIAGAISSHGGAILADDMHLGIRVPGTWYKAQLIWGDADKQTSIAGVTLPGTPAIVAGSNGHIAWGFTNSTADWADVVQLEISDDGKTYQTADGAKEFSYNNEVIKIKGQPDKIVLIKETQWGPVMAPPFEQYALRWVAYDKEGINMNLLAFEQAATVDEALQLAATLGIPAQNLLVADTAGNIGWTIAGAIPQRQLADLNTPQLWHKDNNQWSGYLTADAYPKVKNPADHRLWTANSRVVGGKALKLIGDGGYDLGARAQQIRDNLLAKDQHDEQSLHQIQLDHRALFLQRWQQLLLTVLNDDFVQQYQLQSYKKLVETDSVAASKDAVGYSLVRTFRDQTIKAIFSPLAALLEQQQLKLADLKMVPETPAWALLQAQRIDTVPAPYISWSQLLQQAVLDSIQTLEQQSAGPATAANWGKLNTARIRHPMSAVLPWFAPWLDMPADQLAGDRHMPRVQLPVHGQSERMVVSPGREQSGILTIPAGQSGHPLSPFYRADHPFWLNEQALGFLPGAEKYRLELQPQG